MRELIAKWGGKIEVAAGRIRQVLIGVVSSVFGHISWNPPGWLARSAAACARFYRSRPNLTTSLILSVFFLGCASAWSWHWYQHQPKPHRVTATIDAIPVTRLEKDLKFPSLNIAFSESAARLEDLKKPSLSGVRLDPAIAGTWRWNNDKHLVFKPTEDWPAEKKIRIIFDRNFFPRHVLMERLTYEAQTPSFEIAIKDLQLYQDPTNPGQRQITATFELTHSIEPGELERHVELAKVGEANLFAASDPAPHFAITYGSHRRLAFLRSSPVTLPEKEQFLKVSMSKGVHTVQGGAATQGDAEKKILIPSVATMFRIDSSEGIIAQNKTGEPEQVLILTTTSDIGTRDLAKALDVRLLPKKKIEKKTTIPKPKRPTKVRLRLRKAKPPVTRTIPPTKLLRDNRPLRKQKNGRAPRMSRTTFGIRPNMSK